MKKLKYLLAAVICLTVFVASSFTVCAVDLESHDCAGHFFIEGVEFDVHDLEGAAIVFSAAEPLSVDGVVASCPACNGGPLEAYYFYDVPYNESVKCQHYPYGYDEVPAIHDETRYHCLNCGYTRSEYFNIRFVSGWGKCYGYDRV